MPNHPYLGYQLNDIFYYRPYPYGNQGAVSSNSPYATAAGLEILKKGGNVFDAACAVSLTLGLVGPYHSGIGGGCFYVFYHKDSNQFYCCDARGVAPIHASADMFLDENGDVDLNLTEFSGRSTAVPALYRALDEILQKYGTMNWEEVSTPAIELARKGFYCGFPYARISDTPEAEHNRDSYEGFSNYYLHNGKPRTYGEKITNPDLADTMEQVAQKGVDWFYTGPIADEIPVRAEKQGCHGQRRPGQLQAESPYPGSRDFPGIRHHFHGASLFRWDPCNPDAEYPGKLRSESHGLPFGSGHPCNCGNHENDVCRPFCGYGRSGFRENPAG